MSHATGAWLIVVDAACSTSIFSRVAIMEQLKQYVKLNRIEEALAIVKSAWGDTPNYEQVRRSPITPRMPAY